MMEVEEMRRKRRDTSVEGEGVLKEEYMYICKIRIDVKRKPKVRAPAAVFGGLFTPCVDASLPPHPRPDHILHFCISSLHHIKARAGLCGQAIFIKHYSYGWIISNIEKIL